MTLKSSEQSVSVQVDDHCCLRGWAGGGGHEVLPLEQGRLPQLYRKQIIWTIFQIWIYLFIDITSLELRNG